MGDTNPKYLSAEELRSRLYHSLRNRGLVDTIKCQLRNSLVTELQQSVKEPLSLNDVPSPTESSLALKAANSLVANHLKSCTYEYSLSVFLPECGLGQDKQLETNDLLNLLKINPQSRLYQKLSKEYKDSKKGFLWQLLSEVSALHANSTNTISCQTDHIKMGPVSPLDEKLSDVDELYSSKRDDYLQVSRAGAEERMLSFQRQLEDRYNTQLKLELSRMRDAEISAIKMEEKENSRKSLDQARRELERIYKDKHDALVQRERNALERLQQQTELQEKETYSQRQSILDEIESVRQRETELRREAEAMKREKKVSEERVKDKDDNLKRRELEIQQKENCFEQRLQNEMAQFKLEQQARFLDRIQNVEIRETKIKEGERIVSEEKSRLQQYKDDLRDKTHRVNELETFLSEAKHSEINATKNNEYLNAKLRDMSDYSTLKEQVILYRNELEAVRTRLAEVLSMNERERGRQEELLRELRRPSPESLMLQRDLERSKESLRQEQLMFSQQKQLLEARLKEELDRNKEMYARFEEQTLQMKEMNREVVDLRQQLHMTTKALNNEIYRKPKDAVERSGNTEEKQEVVNMSRRVSDTLDTRGKHEVSQPGQFGTKDVYHGVDYDLTFGCNSADLGDEDISSSDSADLIAQAKYRLKTLDTEANKLEEVYHNFHCRLTNPSALSNVVHTPSRRTPVKEVATHDVSPPRHSPIVFDQPMSSTPYKQPRSKQPLNESFDEFGKDLTKNRERQTSSSTKIKSTTPAFVLDSSLDDKFDKHQPTSITMNDLEKRSGSPEIVVVGDSASTNEDVEANEPKLDSEKESMEAVNPTGQTESLVREHHGLPLTDPSAGFSLDLAWKSQLNQQKEDESRKEELEKHNSPRREQEQAVKPPESLDTAENEEDDDKIDPVMKTYMARIQKQREEEKQKAKQVVDTWSRGMSVEKTPSQSEEELSAGVDKSEQEDDDFSF